MGQEWDENEKRVGEWVVIENGALVFSYRERSEGVGERDQREDIWQLKEVEVEEWLLCVEDGRDGG